MAKEAKSKKATAKVVDMSKVKDRGQFNPRHVADGEYVMKIREVLDHESKQGNSSWLVVFVSDKIPGASYPYYCGNDDPDQLWKIRNVYMAAGINVPKKKMKLDPANQIVNKTVGVTLEGDEYEGKMKSKVQGVLPASEVQEADLPDAGEDDEKPAKSKGKKAKGKKGKKKADDAELEELEVEEL